MTGVIKTDANGVVQTDANGVIQTVSSATAQFDVAIASTTSPVAPGDELGVTATVDNTGGAQGTQTITLDINNGVGQVDSASVTLSAGGSTTQTLSWAVPSGQTEQDYTATVSSADDTASQTVTVNQYITVFDQTFPYSPSIANGSVTFDQVASTAHSDAAALTIDQDASTANKNDQFFAVTTDVDATNKSTLNCVTEFTRDGSSDPLVIKLGGQTLYNSTVSHSFTERSFDISGISGVVTLKIGHNISINITREPKSTITEIELV